MGCESRHPADTDERLEELLEYRVTASWELGSVIDAIANEGEIARLRARADTMPPAEALPVRFSIGVMMKESLDRKRRGLRLEVVSSLAEHAVDYGLKGQTGYGTVMDAAFRVARSRERAFQGRLRELDARFGGSLSFDSSGPVPLSPGGWQPAGPAPQTGVCYGSRTRGHRGRH